VENFIGHFLVPPNAPTAIAKEMLLHFLKLVEQIEVEGKAAMEAQAAEDAKVEQAPAEELAQEIA